MVAFVLVGALFSRAAFAGPGVAMVQTRTGGFAPAFTALPGNLQGNEGIVGRTEVQPIGLPGDSVLPVLPDSVVNQVFIEPWDGPETAGISPAMARGAMLRGQVSGRAFTADRSVSAPVAAHRSIEAKAFEVSRLRQAAAKTMPTDEGYAAFGDKLMAVLKGEEHPGYSTMGEVSAGQFARSSLGILNRSFSPGSGHAVMLVPTTASAGRLNAPSSRLKDGARVVPPLGLWIYKKSLVVSVGPALGGVTTLDLMTRGGALIVRERTPAAVAAGSMALREAVAERPVFQNDGSDFEPVAGKGEDRFVEISGIARGSMFETISFLELRGSDSDVRRTADWRGSFQPSYSQAIRGQAKAPALDDLLPPASLITALLPFLGLIILLNSRLFL